MTLLRGIGEVKRRRRRGPPLVLCIDIEPDERLTERDGTAAMRGFERLLEQLPELRVRLEAASGRSARITWFLRMDVQIAETWGGPAWIAERYRDQLEAFEASADELGVHTHNWRWDDGAGEWFAERLDEGWIRECTELSLETFEAGFGRRCAAHRGGDHFLSPAMIEALRAHGVAVDLSVEPGALPEVEPVPGERGHGAGPDYRAAPHLPYRPRSADDFLTPGGGATLPLEIPLLSDRGPQGPAMLIPWIEPALFAPRLDALLEQDPPPVIALAIRTDLPLHLQWHWFVANVEYVAAHPRLRGSEFVTASEAAAQIEAGLSAAA